MISQHEFIIAVRDDIWPRIQKLEEDCLYLFNKAFPLGRGPTGVTGNSEIEWTIQLLNSCENLLKRLAIETGVLVKVDGAKEATKRSCPGGDVFSPHCSLLLDCLRDCAALNAMEGTKE